MNRSSLSQAYVKKQQYSSWIGDSYNRKEEKFKGMKPIFNTITLSNYTEDLVGHYAKFDGVSYNLFLCDLSEHDQNELARLYIESTDRDTSECIYGDDFSINNPYTCALLAMLNDDCKRTREHFADVTRKNILTYYKESLNDLLSSACDNLLYIQMNEQGLHMQHDPDHGDVFWGKF